MKRKWSAGIAGLAGGAAIALCIGVGVGAAAADQQPAGPATDSSLVKPVQNVQGRQYFSEAQIDGVWRAVTHHFPAPLPADVTFPSKAPDFFHPNTPHPMFEAGLPDMIAAQYWRCAWLEKASSDTSADPAAVQLDTQQLNRFAELPSVSKNLDLAAYDQLTAQYAKEKGVSAFDAEIALQCSSFASTEVTK